MRSVLVCLIMLISFNVCFGKNMCGNMPEFTPIPIFETDEKKIKEEKLKINETIYVNYIVALVTYAKCMEDYVRKNTI